MRDWTIAEADIWVSPELAGDTRNTRQMLAIAAARAREMGANRVITYVPEIYVEDLIQGNVVRRELGAGDPWYLKELK